MCHADKKYNTSNSYLYKIIDEIIYNIVMWRIAAESRPMASLNWVTVAIASINADVLSIRSNNETWIKIEILAFRRTHLKCRLESINILFISQRIKLS